MSSQTHATPATSSPGYRAEGQDAPQGGHAEAVASYQLTPSRAARRARMSSRTARRAAIARAV